MSRIGTLLDKDNEREEEKKSRISQSMSKGTSVSDSDIEDFVRSSRRDISNSANRYGTSGYKDTQEGYDEHLQNYWDNKRKADDIKVFLRANRNNIDEETSDNIRSYINEYVNSSNEVGRAYRDKLQGYRPFKTEEDYNKAIEDYNQARIKELEEYDTEKGKKELEALNKEYEEKFGSSGIERFGKYILEPTLSGRHAMKEERKAFEQKLAKANAEYNQASDYQNAMKLASDAANASDFKQFGTLDDTVLQTYKQKKREAQANGLHGSEIEDYATANGGVDEFTFNNMSDEEKRIYNYYLNKGDTENAKAYLYSIKETVNQRKAMDLAEGATSGSFIPQMANRLATDVIIGLDQFNTGFDTAVDATLGGNPDTRPTEWAYANQLIGENIDSKVGKVAHDLTVTTSNMLPSILVGSIAGMASGGTGLSAVAGTAMRGLGTSMMGVSAGGNAYAEMINLGYTQDQAKAYGVLTGISETCLQNAMGGIAGLGKNGLSKVAVNSVSKMDNALARMAIKHPVMVKYLADMGSEGAEEFLQDVLSPLMQNAITGSDESVDWGQALYSGLLGALSAGVLNSLPSLNEASQLNKAGKEVKKSSDQLEAVKDLASSYPVDTAIAQLGSQINEKTSAMRIGALLGEMNANLTEANKASIIGELTSRGVSQEGAEKIAEAFAHSIEGTANEIEMELLNDDEIITPAIQVALDAIKYNPNSEVNKRMFDLEDVTNDVIKGVQSQPTVKDKVQKALKITPKEETQTVQREPVRPETVKRVEDLANRVSESESAQYNGKDVEIKGFGKNSDYLKLADGTEVSRKGVSYKDSSQAIIYESIADLGINNVASNMLVKAYDGSISPTKYADDISRVFEAGKIGYPVEKLAGIKLNEVQKQNAYGLGRIEARFQTAEATHKTKTASKKDSGVFQAGEKVDKSTLTKTQRASVDVIEKLTKATGLRVELYDSKNTDKTSQKKADGYYQNNVIWLDINAENNGLMLYTMSHEITHFIKEWSPTKFQTLADFLVKEYARNNVDVESLIALKQRQYEKQGVKLDKDAAYEEVVCDSMKTMLTDTDAVAKIAKLRNKDASLVNKIESHLKDLVAKVKEIYSTYSPTTVEAKTVRNMQDSLEKLSDLFAEGVVSAAENYEKAQKNTTTEDSGVVRYSAKEVKDLSIREQIKANQEMLNKLAPVASIDMQTMKGKRTVDLIKKVSDYYKKKGYEVDRQNFGKILLGKNEIDESMHYVNTDAEYSAFYVVDKVLKQGKILKNEMHPDHKGRGYSTITFAAPVIIGGTRGNMAVVVKQTGKNRYKTHRIIMPDGTEFVLDKNKTDATTGRMTVENNGESLPITSVSTDIISQTETKSNTSEKKTFALKGLENYTTEELDSLVTDYAKDLINEYDLGVEVVAVAPYGSRTKGTSRTDSDLDYVLEFKGDMSEDSLLDILNEEPLEIDGIKVDINPVTEGKSGTIEQYFDRLNSYDDTKYSLKDSDGNTLSKEQQDFFKDSKVRDEDGNLLVVYHGTSEQFTVFDKTKTRANMDIQGNFFSPWEIDAKDYGENVNAYYLNITNPADEGTAYKALNMFKGQNEAGVKAREYLEKLGYDGVNNGDEEYIAFNSNQIKLINNTKPTENEDIRYSLKDKDYMSAVENGDTETAQRLVDEAAEQAFSKSFVRDNDGKLLDVYHGTVSQFTKFKRKYSQIEGDFGKGFYFSNELDDVEQNYANDEGADLTNKISRYAERLEQQDEYSDKDFDELKEIAKQHFITAEPNTIYAYLNMENPVFVGDYLDNKATYLTYEENYNEEEDYYDEPTGTLVDFVEALQECEDEFEVWKSPDYWAILGDSIYDGGINVAEAVQLLKENLLDEVVDENGDIATNELIRQAFEAMGYDGIIDPTVSKKFSNMDGLYEDTTHFIVFNSSQIKDSTPITYDDNGNVIPLSERFNSSNEDIRYSLKPYSEHQKQNWSGSKRIVVYENEAQLRDFIAGAKDKSITDKKMYFGSVSSDLASRIYKATGLQLENYNVSLSAYEIRKIFLDHGTEETELLRGQRPVTENDIIKIPEVVNTPDSISLSPTKYKGKPVISFVKTSGNERTSVFAIVSDKRLDLRVQTMFINAKKRNLATVTDEQASVNTPEAARGTVSYTSIISNNVEDINTQFALKEDTKYAKDLRKEYKTELTENIISQRLDEIRNMQSTITDSNDYTKAYEAAEALAKDILSTGRIVDEESMEIRKRLKSYFSGMKFYVDEQLKAEMAYNYGSWADFQKDMRSKGLMFTTKNEAGLHSLDSVWTELTEQFPGIFTDGVNALEQPMVIANAFDAFDGRAELSQIEEYEMTASIADEIMDRTKPEPIKINPKLDASLSTDARTILSNALIETAKTQAEVNNLTQYQEAISDINELEAQLKDAKAKLKEMSFAPGKRDMRKIEAVQKEVNNLTTKINMQDRKLLQLQSTKPLKELVARERVQVEKNIKREMSDALAQQRKQEAQKRQDIIDKYTESRKKRVEDRKRTELKHKILKQVKNLNNLLLKENKDKHIPVQLKNNVIDALMAIDTRMSNTEAQLEAKRQEIERAKSPAVRERLEEQYDRILAKNESMTENLRALRDLYDSLRTEEGIYDPMIAEVLSSVIEDVGNTPLRDMSYNQLQRVYDLYRMIEHTISNSNKLFRENQRATVVESAQTVMNEIKEVGGKNKDGMKMFQGLKDFAWNDLKPVYFFKMLGSDELYKCYKDLSDGQGVWAKDVVEAKEFFDKQRKKYNYDKWEDTTKTFTATNGQTFELNTGLMMSIYAYSKREQALSHFMEGGITLDGIEYKKKTKAGIKATFTVNTATAFGISETTLKEIISSLTPEQKAFVDVTQSFLSTVMGAKGNEVSMQLYGVELFKEKNYFPLRSAKQYQIEETQYVGETRLKNSGFTKQVVPGANNPIVLDDYSQVWTEHSEKMSLYHALTLPLENLSRVWNYKTPNISADSVKTTLQNAYGARVNNYISDLLKNLNGGTRSDSQAGLLNKMISKFKKGAVFASASVTIQQPSAIARAFAIVNPKYFVTNPRLSEHSEAWEEVKRYAPVAVIKEMGYFDTNMGQSTTDWMLANEYEGFADKAKAIFTDSNYRDELLSKAPALADELTWVQIWEACKNEQRAEKGLEGEELLQVAGERFTEVIELTQVYDSVLSRSALMRSKDTGVKMATAFMAEPTTSINMLAYAILRQSKAERVQTFSAVGASIILNSALVSIIYAMRDDDDDKTYAEKYLMSFVSSLASGLNPLGLIPYTKDIMSIIEGYSVERADMSTISDVVTAFMNLGKDSKTFEQKMYGIVGSLGNMFGIPVRNLWRDTRGLVNTVEQAVTSDLHTTSYGLAEAAKSGLPIVGGNVGKKERLVSALKSGDKEAIQRARSFYDKGDEKKTNSAIRSALSNAFKDDYIKAYQKNNTEKMYEIRKMMQSSGAYESSDDVVKACQRWIKSLAETKK